MMVRRKTADLPPVETWGPMPMPVLPAVRRGLRRPEAAAFCGVGEATSQAWVNAGIMPKPIRPPGSTLSIWDLFDVNEAFSRLKEADAGRPNAFD
jgi:predicted DNA-binding transcriptional regulator AlpA